MHPKQHEEYQTNGPAPPPGPPTERPCRLACDRRCAHDDALWHPRGIAAYRQQQASTRPSGRGWSPVHGGEQVLAEPGLLEPSGDVELTFASLGCADDLDGGVEHDGTPQSSTGTCPHRVRGRRLRRRRTPKTGGRRPAASAAAYRNADRSRPHPHHPDDRHPQSTEPHTTARSGHASASYGHLYPTEAITKGPSRLPPFVPRLLHSAATT